MSEADGGRREEGGRSLSFSDSFGGTEIRNGQRGHLGQLLGLLQGPLDHASLGGGFIVQIEKA